jgi:hypothetical protein
MVGNLLFLFGVVGFVLTGFILIGIAAAFAVPAVALIGLAIIIVTLFLAASLTARRRTTLRLRKRLCALIGVVYDLPLGTTGWLLEDDAACSGWFQRLLRDHQVSYSVPLYDERGRYLFARPGKIRVLADALTRAVGRGHDNELFVILADLLELDSHLEPLLKAVRVARARHHQVLIVSPWPVGIHRRTAPEFPPANADPGELARFASRSRTQRAWQNVRRAFGRLGVPVVPAAEGESARLILHRLERLRSGQGVRRA